MTNNEQRAYFAGFFDGEGSLGIYPNNVGGYGLRVSVGQKLLTQLERLQSVYGGGISKKDCSVWTVCGLNAYNFVTDIYPWVQEKRDQVELAIEYCYEFGVGAGRNGRSNGGRSVAEKERQQLMSEQMRALKYTEILNPEAVER